MEPIIIRRFKLKKYFNEEVHKMTNKENENSLRFCIEMTKESDLANKELSRFRKKGMPYDFEVKLDKMFGGTCATGKHAYAPSSRLPLLTSPKQYNNDDILEDSGDSDDLLPPKSTQVNKRKGQNVEDVWNEKGKGVAIKNGKVGGVVKLSQQIDRMCSAIESMSIATSMMN